MDENFFDDDIEMLPSDNKIVNIDTIKTKRNIEISAEKDFFSASMYTEDAWDAKAFNTLIKNVEKHIRTSEEYKNYIGYLKEEIGLRRCAVLGNVDDSMTAIEFHHYPFTLYDIVFIVANAKLFRKEKLSSFLMAHEILQLHYDNVIGLVPLSITVHELVHAGEIFISLKQVFGDVNGFVEMYRDGLTEDYIDTFNKLIDRTNMNTQVDFNGVLDKGKKSWNLQKNETLNYKDV
jgi:hypothetical protein